MLRGLFVVLLYCVLANVNAFADENPDYVNLMQRARAEYRAGRFAASQAAYLGALQTLQRTDEVQRALVLRELGDVYINEDQLQKAERAYLDSKALYARLSDTNSTVQVLRNIGALYSMQRRDDGALKVLGQAMKLAKTSPGNPNLVPQVLNSFGLIYIRQGKYSKAESCLKQALQASSRSGDYANIVHNLGTAYYAQRNFKKGEELLKEALQMTEDEVGPNHPDLTFRLSSLADLYMEAGNYSEAENQYQRALRILEPNKSAFETRIARLLYGLSATYTKAGRKAEADAALSEAAIIARRNLAEHADMAIILEAYSAILKKQGKPKEAEALLGEARRARAAAGLVVNAHSLF